MKHVSTLSVLAAAIFAATTASALDIPDTIRGPISADLKAQIAAPVKVATCPTGFNEKFANQKLACERTVRQTASIVCPSNFPNYVARNVAGTDSVFSDRDLCAKAGVNIPSTGSLAGLTAGTDFKRVPLDGTDGSVSYVAGHPNASEVNAQAWRLDTSNSGPSGISDRYKRSFIVKTSPILVNP